MVAIEEWEKQLWMAVTGYIWNGCIEANMPKAPSS